jgi:mRNA interferase RelE/StbE
MFELAIRRKALRQIEKLDTKRKRTIKETLLLLKSDPVPVRRLDVSKLKGYEDIYRIRIGRLRIVYQVLWSERKIIICSWGPEEKPLNPFQGHSTEAAIPKEFVILNS